MNNLRILNVGLEDEPVVEPTPAPQPTPEQRSFAPVGENNPTRRDNAYKYGEEDASYEVHTITETDYFRDTPTHVVRDIEVSGSEANQFYSHSRQLKGIEEEIAFAAQSGMTQIALNMKGLSSDDVAALQEKHGLEVDFETRGKGMSADEANRLAPDVHQVAKLAYNRVQSGRSESIEDALEFLAGEHEVLANPAARRVAGIVAEDPGYDISAALQSADMEDYAIFKFTKASDANQSILSQPARGVTAAYSAMRDGYTREEVAQELQAQGFSYTEDLLDQAERALQAHADGYSDEEILAFIEGQDPPETGFSSEPISELQMPDENTAFGEAYRALLGSDEMTPRELMARLNVVYPNLSFMTTDIAGFFGNEDARRLSEAAAEASRSKIIEAAAARGLEVRFEAGKAYAITEDGAQEISPEWWRSFWEAKGEIAGGIAGGVYGFRAGMAAPVWHPWAKGAIVIGSSIAGAAAGAAGGAQLDYLHNAILLQEDIDGYVMARKALTSVEASVVLDAAFLGTMKLSGTTWRTIAGAVNDVRNGEMSRAAKGLQEQLFITADEADELVRQLGRVAQVPGRNRAEQRIAATLLTKPGAEHVAGAMGRIDSRSTAAVAHSINQRAQDLLRTTGANADADIGRLLKNEMLVYRTQVMEQFTALKAVPANSPRANQWGFDFNELAIQPALERLGKNIEYAGSPELSFKFQAQMGRIRDLTESRSLADLVELRSLVNEFKYNSRITKAPDFDMVNEVIRRIDDQIRAGAHATLDNPQQWLDDFATARADYAVMKNLERNTLIRAVSRPSVKPEDAARLVTRYAGVIDDTFVQAMAQLPAGTRAKVESTVLNTLAETYTAGLTGGMRATNFPMLADKVRNMTFTTPEARAMRSVILEFGDVFKNDVPLANIAGDLRIQPNQHYLGADPVTRAKLDISNGVMDWMKSFLPTAPARAKALVRQSAKVLNDPLDAKSMQELMDQFEGNPEMRAQLQRLAVEAAKAQAEHGSVGAARIKLYGSGEILRTRPGLTRSRDTERTIALHRIASRDQVREVADSLGINLSDTQNLMGALRERGYAAYQLGDNSVRVLEVRQ